MGYKRKYYTVGTSFWKKDFISMYFGQFLETDGCPAVLQFTQKGLFVQIGRVGWLLPQLKQLLLFVQCLEI